MVLPPWLRYAFAVAYAYGAVVHCMNILGLSGFDWSAAPAKWQLLDVAYLALDISVVGLLVRGHTLGTVLLGAAAASQIALYTLLRAWVLDVPVAYEVGPGAERYLDFLVAFHALTPISILATSRWQTSMRRRGGQCT